MIVSCGTSNCPMGGLCCPYTLNAIMENNGTRLQCLATTAFSCTESDVVERSNTVGLQIQGNYYHFLYY